MAKVEILGQAHQDGRMLIRGVFSQKKNLWDAIAECYPDNVENDLNLRDDEGKEVGANYARLCTALRKTGRATFFKKDGTRVFQVIESNMNQVREWDIDQDGNPVPNPVV